MAKDQEDILGNDLAKNSRMGAAFGSFLDGLPGDALSSGAGTYLGVKLAAKFLPTESHSEKLRIGMHPEKVIKLAYSVLAKAGALEKNDETPPYPFLKAKVGSGAFNMNPAVVYVEILDGDATSCEVTITGAAKEGLIKQHTAEKAVKRVVEALRALAMA